MLPPGSSVHYKKKHFVDDNIYFGEHDFIEMCSISFAGRYEAISK